MNLRPVLHFTPKKNWMNDPNGLVFYEGEYHLFYQHNPFENFWGHMSWGHAVSKDLITWQHLPIALKEENNTMIFSGSAAVDWDNTSGFGTVDEPPLVAAYTSRNNKTKIQAQCIAYSLDKGRNWEKYKFNPVINIDSDDFRDPKVFWHNKSKKWIMVVAHPKKRQLGFYGSANLLKWIHLSTFGPEGSTAGEWECPDLMELSTSDGEKKWLLKVDMSTKSNNGGSGGQYFYGYFDGKKFLTDKYCNTVNWIDYGNDFYAASVWSDLYSKKLKNVWIGWFNNWIYADKIPTGEYKGIYSLPRELSMKKVDCKYILIQKPVELVTKNRIEILKVTNEKILSIINKIKSLRLSPLPFEVILEISMQQLNFLNMIFENESEEKIIIDIDIRTKSVKLDRRFSGKVDFSPHFAKDFTAPILCEGNKLKIYLLFDINTIELFLNEGESVISSLIFPSDFNYKISIDTDNNNSIIDKFELVQIEI